MLERIKSLFADMNPVIDECVAHMQSQMEGEDVDNLRKWVDLKFAGHALNAPIKFFDAMHSTLFATGRPVEIEPTADAFKEAVKAEVDSFSTFKLWHS